MDLGFGVSILWSDEVLIAVNKPAGLPTLPDGYQPEAPCLVRVLEQEVGRLWVVHRLDRVTSGILVFARTALSHRALNIQFESRQVAKLYHALVLGVPAWEEQTADLPLRVDGDRQHRTVVDAARGKSAVTQFSVLERFAECALVAAQPHTGRTHQIRSHLAALGYPLVADALYGGASADATPPRESLLGRPALHARSLELAHPVTNRPLCFEAPYPDDLAAALQRLRAPG